MSYAGHVWDMINRIKANKQQSKSRKDRRNKLKNLYSDSLKYSTIQNNEKKFSKEELDVIKDQIRFTMKRDAQKEMIIFIIVSSIIVIIIGYLMFSYFGSKHF